MSRSTVVRGASACPFVTVKPNELLENCWNKRPVSVPSIQHAGGIPLPCLRVLMKRETSNPDFLRASKDRLTAVPTSVSAAGFGPSGAK